MSRVRDLASDLKAVIDEFCVHGEDRVTLAKMIVEEYDREMEAALRRVRERAVVLAQALGSVESRKGEVRGGDQVDG